MRHRLELIELGIIPARAGFTPPKRGWTSTCPDHPRSRGVYRGDVWVFDPQGRIIPARAGFTAGPPRLDQSGRDHPRSRGVYCMESVSA